MTKERSLPAAGLYHGWKVIAALFVAGMMVYGCGLYSFTLFITPLTDEFGWSRAATSGLVSAYWLAAPLTLLAEPVVRRFGGFRIVTAGVLLAAAATFLLALCDNLSLLFSLRILMGIGKVMMACGVTLLAAHWFNRNFGLALACCYAGWHFGGLVLVPLTQWLIDAFGWRMTSAVLAVAILAVSLPPLFAWARAASPVSRGLVPETDLPRAADPDIATGVSATKKGQFARTLRQPALWLSIAITVLAAAAYGALLANEAALVDGQTALAGVGQVAVSVTACSALVAALAMGWLADRVAFRPLLFVELTLFLLGIAGFLALYAHPTTALVVAAAACFGFAIGGLEAAVLPNLRRVIGTARFDHAFGIWYLSYLAMLFASPIWAGWMFDRFASYAPALWLLLFTTAAAAIPALLMPAALADEGAQERGTAPR